MPVTHRVLLAAALVMVLLPRAAGAVDEAAGQERLGFRAGYVGTTDGLNDFYGDGWDLTLFFTEKLYSKILLDVRLGAIYLGDALEPDLDDQITLSPGIVSQLRFLYFSAGPLAGFKLGQSYSGYASLGIGIYSVSMEFDSGVSAFDYSDQHIGYNGGLGLARRIASNWSIELNGTVHYFGVDENATDLYWVFTGGADAPLLVGVALGLTVDLR
jgi:hypothetical protein